MIISNDEERIFISQKTMVIISRRNKIRMIALPGARVRELMSPRDIQIPHGGSADPRRVQPPLQPPIIRRAELPKTPASDFNIS